MNQELKDQLIGLGLTEDQIAKLEAQGVNEASDMSLLTAAEIVTHTGGCGLIIAKKIVSNFIPKVDQTVPTINASFDILPSVPSDEAWLDSLKVGGVLKFNASTVIGTVSAALAHKVGLYDLPKKIGDAMEQQAKTLLEPVGEDFYKMQNLLVRRNYSEIFAAMPGVDGKFATQGRKDALLDRINEKLWVSLGSYQQQLKQWVDSWQQGMANPAAMMSMLASIGGGGGGVATGMMQQIPSTDVLHDSADSVVNDINYVFAGTGIPVALALAYDAQQIRKVLENPNLPAQVGASNREQMLRLLKVDVSSDYPRLEKNLKQFVLGIIEFKNVTPGNTELQYVWALNQLGAQIPWDKLGEGISSSLGKRPL